MEIKHFALSTSDNSKAIRYIRIVFGIVCIAVAVFWLSFNIKSLKADGTLWITILFLSGFGFYQIWSGLGRAIRFIEIGPDCISLRKNSFLPTSVFPAGEIEKIELFPMNVVFFIKSKKRILLRFGSTFQETNEKIKDELLVFAESNNIEIKFIEEKL
jgi:hypothetical protein